MGINAVNQNIYQNNYSNLESFKKQKIDNQPYTNTVIKNKNLEEDSSFLGLYDFGCKDGVDDGSIGFIEASKNVLKGGIKFFTGMFTDENGNFSTKQTLKTLAIGVAIGLATTIPIIGPLVLPSLCAFGLCHGGAEVISGISNAMDAKTDEEAQKAWQQVGSGTTEGIASYTGYKASGGFKKSWAKSKADYTALKTKFSNNSVKGNSAEIKTNAEQNSTTEPEIKQESNINTEAEAKAKAEAETKAKAEAEAKAKAEAEAKAKAEAEAKAKAEAEAKAKAEAEAKTKSEAEAKAKAEAEAKAKAEAEAKAKAEAEAKAKSEAEAKAKAEAEAKAKAEAEAKAKAEAEAKAKAEAEAKTNAEAERQIRFEKDENFANNYVKEHMEELDKLLINEDGKISCGYDSKTGKEIYQSLDELITESTENIGEIYHYTDEQTKAKILAEGFKQNIAPKHGYLDGVGGSYFTTVKQGDGGYGSTFVKARFNGKVANINPQRINDAQNCNSLKMWKFLKEKGFNPKEASDKSNVILRHYFKQKVLSKGYSGVYTTEASWAARCKYFSALDPSKIEIIG